MDYSNYPTSRSQAKSLRAKYYFTGIPCKHGHIALRKTKGVCIECMKIESNGAYTRRKDYFVHYNKTKGVENKKRYYQANREKVIEKAKARSKEDQKRYRQAWKKAHPEEVKAFLNDRRRRHKNACPKWLSTGQKSEIRSIYKQALTTTIDTGIPHAVDHIVPLIGKQVCGLHVPWNLQVITAEENYKKNNKLLDTTQNQA